MGNFVRLSKRNIYQLYSLYPLHAEREVIIRFGKYHIIEEKYIPLLRIKIARKLPMLMSKKIHDFLCHVSILSLIVKQALVIQLREGGNIFDNHLETNKG